MEDRMDASPKVEEVPQENLESDPKDDKCLLAASQLKTNEVEEVLPKIVEEEKVKCQRCIERERTIRHLGTDINIAVRSEQIWKEKYQKLEEINMKLQTKLKKFLKEEEDITDLADYDLDKKPGSYLVSSQTYEDSERNCYKALIKLNQMTNICFNICKEYVPRFLKQLKRNPSFDYPHIMMGNSILSKKQMYDVILKMFPDKVSTKFGVWNYETEDVKEFPEHEILMDKPPLTLPVPISTKAGKPFFEIGKHYTAQVFQTLKERQAEEVLIGNAGGEAKLPEEANSSRDNFDNAQINSRLVSEIEKSESDPALDAMYERNHGTIEPLDTSDISEFMGITPFYAFVGRNRTADPVRRLSNRASRALSEKVYTAKEERHETVHNVPVKRTSSGRIIKRSLQFSPESKREPIPCQRSVYHNGSTLAPSETSIKGTLSSVISKSYSPNLPMVVPNYSSSRKTICPESKVPNSITEPPNNFYQEMPLTFPMTNTSNLRTASVLSKKAPRIRSEGDESLVKINTVEEKSRAVSRRKQTASNSSTNRASSVEVKEENRPKFYIPSKKAARGGKKLLNVEKKLITGLRRSSRESVEFLNFHPKRKYHKLPMPKERQ